MKQAWSLSRAMRQLPAGMALRMRAPAGRDVPTSRAVRYGLKTRRLGRPLALLRRASSTNEVALAFAEGGCPAGTCVVAEEQTQGRGRQGRQWHCTPGGGLLFSVVLRPALPLSRAQVLTFLGAVAAAQALRELHGMPVELKWPNDLTLGGRKLAGVLTEVAGEQGAIRHAVVGVGINVNMPSSDLPAGVREEALSVSDFTGAPVERVPILRRILEGMEARLHALERQGAEGLVREWRSLTHMPGTTVRIRQQSRVWEGTVAGFDPDGTLLLRLESGVVERFVAGDVTVLRK